MRPVFFHHGAGSNQGYQEVRSNRRTRLLETGPRLVLVYLLPFLFRSLSLDRVLLFGHSDINSTRLEVKPRSFMNLPHNKSLTLRFQKVASSKALAILLLIASISPNLFAANLLLDGSFENVSGVPANGYSLFTGDIGDGWVVTQNEILIERGTLNGVPHTGNQLAYLDGDLGFNTLSQTIPTTPGLAYMISLWVADSNPNLLQIAFAGQSLFNGTAPASGGGFPATGWVQETFIATATSTTSTLSISGQWTGGTGTVLDDVSVQVVPEPASVSLLCCALASRFALRRRSCNPPRCT